MKYLEQHTIIKKIPREMIEAAFTKSKETWTDTLKIKGPGSSAFVIEILAKDVFEIRFIMNYILQKFSFKYDHTSMSKFEKYGAVTTRPLKNYESRLKELTPDSRSVNAVKVIEMKNKKQLKFLCPPNVMLTTSKKLEALDYEIESVEVEYFPKEKVFLKKSDRLICEKFLEALKKLPHVVGVYDNYHKI